MASIIDKLIEKKQAYDAVYKSIPAFKTSKRVSDFASVDDKGGIWVNGSNLTHEDARRLAEWILEITRDEDG